MANQITVFVANGGPAYPGVNVRIQGPTGIDVTVTTAWNGIATYTYSTSGAQLPTGLYTISLPDILENRLYTDGPSGTYVLSPHEWDNPGPFSSNPHRQFYVLLPFTVRLLVYEHCPGVPTILGEGTVVTVDGLTGIVDSEGIVEFSPVWGATVVEGGVTTGRKFFITQADWPNNDYLFHDGGVDVGSPQLDTFTSLPGEINILVFPADPTTGFLRFEPPGGCDGGGDPPDPETIRSAGVDLVQLGNGHLIRSHGLGGKVRIDRSKDAGATWDNISIINAAFSTRNIPEDGVPTLTRDSRDYLICCWHTVSGAVALFGSADEGLTWTEKSTRAGLYPRAAFKVEALVVAMHNSVLRFFRSDDYGATLTIINELQLGGSGGVSPNNPANPAPPVQLVALKVDKFNVLHLLYEVDIEATPGFPSETELWHRSSTDLLVWSAPNKIAEYGQWPAYASGTRRGAIAWWNNVWNVQQLDDTLTDMINNLAYIGGDFMDFDDDTAVGLVMNHRDELYLAGYKDDVLQTRYSPDESDLVAPQ